MHVFIDLTPLLVYPAGIPIYTLKLIESLSRREDDLRLYGAMAALKPRYYHRLIEVLGPRADAVRVSRAWIPGGLARQWPWLPPLLAIPRLPRLEIVHGVNYLPPPWPRAGRSVITIHDLGFLRHPGRGFPEPAGLSRQIHDAAQRAGAIIAVSRFTRQEVCDLLEVDPQKIFVACNGPQWDETELDESASAEFLRRYALDAGRYLLAVGTLSPRKNYETLLQAFDILTAEEKDARLVIVGDAGWNCASIAAQIRARGERVTWIERSSQIGLKALYQGAAALAMPSWYEGFGIPLLEAMTCGCPVCYATGSAMDEVAGDAGLPVPPDDAREMAAVLRRLWREDQLRGELSRLGRERAARFTWDRAAKETLAAYEHALG